MKTFISNEIILLKQLKQSNKRTNKQQQSNMSSVYKIVNILSAKYGFDIKEATQHVKAEIQAYKNLTKEEKDAIKEAEKQAKAAAKEAAKQAKEAAKLAAKQAKEAAKADKASKPKKERTEKQQAAFEKMIAANKAKRAAKLAAKDLDDSSVNIVESSVIPVNLVESSVIPVNDDVYQADMNVKFEKHEAVEEKKVKKEKKEKKVKKVDQTVEPTTLLPSIIPEDEVVIFQPPFEQKKKTKKTKKEKVEESADDNMLAVFDNL